MSSPRVRRILLLALVGGILVDVVVPGNAAGVNAPIVMLALLGGAFFVAGRDGFRRLDVADAWMPPAAVGLAAMAAVRADDWLILWDLAFAAALAAGSIACLAGGRITRGVVPRVLELAVGVTAAAGAGILVLVGGMPDPHAAPAEPPPSPYAARPGTAAAGPDRLRRWVVRVAPVLRGVVIAVPIVFVFGALFVSADAVFARLASDVLSWHPDVDVEDLVGRAFVVLLVAWCAAGLLGLAGGLMPVFLPDALEVGGAAARPARRSLGAASATDLAGPDRDRLGSTEAATVLAVVDGLFAVFVVLQVAYLFGGHETMTLAGLTYAEYARRGFFELVLVAVLAGTLAVTLDLAVGLRSRVQLAAALALLGLTGVVLASALLRLRLYQDAYGWTELRFVVLTAIAWLSVALAVAAGLLLARRTPWTLHALGIMVLVTIAAMNVVGPQAFVTARNVERAIDPSLVPPGGRTGLDAGYLEELGDEAVVPVLAAWDRLGAGDRLALEPFLRHRAEALRSDPRLLGWPAWNLTRERARAALATWEVAAGAASR
jgi:hypothetical protein